MLQPFSDAIKLFSKEEIIPKLSNLRFFVVLPIFGFVVSFFVWLRFVRYRGWVDVQFRVLLFLCVVSIRVYNTILSGWSSISKYSLLGALRAIAQTISYEIVWAFLFLFLIFIYCSSRFLVYLKIQETYLNRLRCLVIFLIFFLVCVVERNRAPFDLAEGESELVSGFNIEYGGFKFALLFLSEYTRIVWLCFLVRVCFLRKILILGWVFTIIIFLYLRSSYPRIRYDYLIDMTWKKFLPLVLILSMVIVFVV